MSSFYITTPIYYVNDVPHLGHAYTTIAADALARFHRMRGEPTFFLTGTDEHGQKVEETAAKRGLTAQQLVDEVAPRFAAAWKTLGITNDDFIRTTEARHKAVVTRLWKRIKDRHPDSLYLETYQGWYCTGCEAFYTESQLERVDDTWSCVIHKRPVNWIDKERSWFFRLSAYAQPLLDHIEKHPDFIQPENYKNEVVAFIRGGLKDLSVSRTSFAWGIPVPDEDPTGLAHVMYVWLDALTNYYAALSDDGELSGPRIEQFWPEAIHLIGKDILRFHAVYWPAFLLAADLPPPKMIRVHGWWSVGGEKISKSMPATRIAPVELATALGEPSSFKFPIGNDAMRYYLLREMPLGNDGNFTFESLLRRYNADLANDLGNLINRSLTMITRFAGEAPPARAAGADASLCATADEAIATATREFAALQPSKALEAIWKLVAAGNKYIDDTKPWEMAKRKDPALPQTLWALGATLWVIGRLIDPVLPAAAAELRSWIGDGGKPAWPRAIEDCPPLACRLGTPLFPRLDDKQQQAIVDAVVAPEYRQAAGAAPAPAPAAKPAKAPKEKAPPPGPIAFDDFAKLDLRVGKVLACTAVPKADKLLHLTVDLGEAAPRSIVSGIALRYKPDELVGKSVIVVANLPPKELKKIQSHGMILAAIGDDDGIVGLSTVAESVPAGTRIQ